LIATIVLQEMAARQTTGGYTRIANVISVDMNLAAKLKPGDRIHYRDISVDEAQELFIVRQSIIQ